MRISARSADRYTSNESAHLLKGAMVIEEGRSRNYWHFKETPLHEFTESRECDDSSAQSDQLERCSTKSRRTLLFSNNFSLISYREVLVEFTTSASVSLLPCSRDL